MTPPDDVGWPPPGSTVVLTWAAGQAPVEVQQVDAQQMTAARTGSAALPQVGTPMLLQWSDAGGLHQRGVDLRVVQHDRVEVHADGTAERTQRREFYRAQTALAAILRTGQETLDGHTMDLSEAGARLWVEGQDPPCLRSTVTTDLLLEGGMLSLPGRVVRSDATPHGAELGVAFDDLPAPLADVIRRQVYRAQLSARREGLHP